MAKKLVKDKLAASLLEELNKEFGEVKAKPEKESRVKIQESGKKESGGEKEEKKKEAVTKSSGQTKEGKKAEGKVKPRSKRYQEALEDIEINQRYDLKQAVELVQKSSYTKFPGTVEIHINTAMKNVRGLVSLPYVSGKKLVIVAFGKGANDSGADIVGSDEILENIIKGKLEAEGKKFDVVITTPEWMPKLARAARVLGPRGMMPNPKNGTISAELDKIVAELQAGKIEYKTENNGQVIHLGIGKVSQPVDEITANIKLLYSTIGKSRITKITLSPTMGPGIKVNLGSI